jgi:hypothetical protein
MVQHSAKHNKNGNATFKKKFLLVILSEPTSSVRSYYDKQLCIENTGKQDLKNETLELQI